MYLFLEDSGFIIFLFSNGNLDKDILCVWNSHIVRFKTRREITPVKLVSQIIKQTLLLVFLIQPSSRRFKNTHRRTLFYFQIKNGTSLSLRQLETDVLQKVHLSIKNKLLNNRTPSDIWNLKSFNQKGCEWQNKKFRFGVVSRKMSRTSVHTFVSCQNN